MDSEMIKQLNEVLDLISRVLTILSVIAGIFIGIIKNKIYRMATWRFFHIVIVGGAIILLLFFLLRYYETITQFYGIFSDRHQNLNLKHEVWDSKGSIDEFSNKDYKFLRFRLKNQLGAGFSVLPITGQTIDLSGYRKGTLHFTMRYDTILFKPIIGIQSGDGDIIDSWVEDSSWSLESTHEGWCSYQIEVHRFLQANLKFNLSKLTQVLMIDVNTISKIYDRHEVCLDIKDIYLERKITPIPLFIIGLSITVGLILLFILIVDRIETKKNAHHPIEPEQNKNKKPTNGK